MGHLRDNSNFNKMGLVILANTCLTIIIELISLIVYCVYIYAAKLFRVFVPRPLKSLDGEIILITGTGNGIGKQIALQLATVAPKAKFICWDNDTKSNEATVAEMRKKRVEVHAYTVDISSRELVATMSAKVRNEIGDVTVIINNAGICPTGPFLLQKPESIEKTFQINLFSHFWILFEFLPQMIRNNHGHIVTIASLSSALPTRDIACYASSKHGVHGFIESLKRELRVHPSKPRNVHFTTVYPVIVQTKLSEVVKVSPRFPEIFPPTIKPEYVAAKTIEGFRQNYDYVYTPPSSQILATLSLVIPIEIQQKIEEDLFRVELEHLNLNQQDVNDYRNSGQNGHKE